MKGWQGTENPRNDVKPTFLGFSFVYSVCQQNWMQFMKIIYAFLIPYDGITLFTVHFSLITDSILNKNALLLIGRKRHYQVYPANI